MQNNESNRDGSVTTGVEQCVSLPQQLELDLEKQDTNQMCTKEEGNHAGDGALVSGSSIPGVNPTFITIVVSSGEAAMSQVASSTKEDIGLVVSPKKGFLSRTTSAHEQCRICQQEKEEGLIDLGCKCKGGLAKSHRSCIDTWFRTRGSNKCEICQDIAVNVTSPDPLPRTNYWVWRIDPTYRQRDEERGCFSPLWVAFSILIGGLLLDVLISLTLGVSAMPVNIIIGVIVVLGLGTAIRLALEFCHEWSFRRVVQRADASLAVGYHPAL